MKNRSLSLFAGLLLALPLFGQAPLPDGSLRFLVVGDWGRRGAHHQKETADQMGHTATEMSAQFVVATGDNIYDDGVRDVDDTRDDCGDVRDQALNELVIEVRQVGQLRPDLGHDFAGVFQRVVRASPIVLMGPNNENGGIAAAVLVVRMSLSARSWLSRGMRLRSTALAVMPESALKMRGARSPKPSMSGLSRSFSIPAPPRATTPFSRGSPDSAS